MMCGSAFGYLCVFVYKNSWNPKSQTPHKEEYQKRDKNFTKTQRKRNRENNLYLFIGKKNLFSAQELSFFFPKVFKVANSQHLIQNIHMNSTVTNITQTENNFFLENNEISHIDILQVKISVHHVVCP